MIQKLRVPTRGAAATSPIQAKSLGGTIKEVSGFDLSRVSTLGLDQLIENIADALKSSTVKSEANPRHRINYYLENVSYGDAAPIC